MHKFTNVKYNLPVEYDKLSFTEKIDVRNQYVGEQNGMCMFCGENIKENPPKHITDKPIDWRLFPRHFLYYPIHLQHNHFTGLTEGAVHAYCNAVLWQYHGR